MFKRFFGGKLLISIFLVLIALLFFIGFFFKKTQRLADTGNMVSHANLVLHQSEKVLFAVAANEAGAKSFLLTGKTSYLDPLSHSENDIVQALADLRQLIPDTKEQKILIDSLSILVNKTLLFSEQLITERQKYGQEAASRFLLSGEDVPFTENTRKLVLAIQSKANEQLAERERTNADRILQTIQVLKALAVLAVILLLLFLAVLIGFFRMRRLQMSKDAYALAQIENVQDAIIATDENMCIKSWNKGAEQMYGWKAEEVIGKIGSDLLQTKFQSFTSEMLIEAFKQNGYFRGEIEQVTRYGKKIMVQVNSSALHDSEGHFIGAVAVYRDITAQKAMELQLLEMNSRLEEKIKLKVSELANIFERITDAFVALDTNWCYTYINARAAEMLDRRPEELLGKNIWDIFPVQEGNPFYDSYHAAMERQEYTYLEAYYPPFDKWMENHIYPSPEGVSIFFNDITSRKKYQQKLQLSEQRFRSLIENGSEIIALVGADFRIQYMSPSVEKILGYRAAERIGTNPLEAVHPDDRPMIQQILGSLLKQPGGIAVAQWRHQHADKTWRWMDGTATNLLHDPSVNAIVHNFREITDRKKMEQELRQSEEKYKLLFYESPLPMIICDTETLQIIDANQAALEQYGYDNRGFARLCITDILIRQKEEVDLERECILAREKLGLGKTDLGIWDHRKRNGEVIKVQVKGHIFQMNNRECMMLVCSDLTERLREQAEAEFNNERFHYVTQATSDAIWDWDMQKNTIYWGDSFESIFGYNLADLNPQSNTREAMIHPDDRGSVMEKIQKAIDDPGCRNWSDEYRFLKSSGDYAYVSDKGIMVRNAGGKVIRIIGAMQDITGIKREEEQLRLLESVVTYANDSVIITEAEPIDGDHPKIIYVNNAFTKVTGYSSKEVIGKTPRILQGPETSRKQLDKLRKNLRKWQPCEIEVINYKKNGEPFWLSISIAPVADKNGRYTHWIAVQRDITERKRIEAELHSKNDELKRLSDYLQNIREEERKLTAKEVHEELGQLVSALKIDIDWLQLKMAAMLDPVAEKRIEHANKIMGVLLKSIRKMASDLRPSVLDDFGLNEALQWHCSDFEILYKVRCVFISEIDDSGLTQKTATVIFRIVQESLINVARHAAAQTVTVILTEDTHTLCLSVVDDGKGFQIESAKSTLGLVGLRERAVSIGGELRIESVPGQGTRVEAFIPRKE